MGGAEIEPQAAVVARRGDGKARILSAALDLFSNQGFEAVSTADIARRAGSSQSVVLYHFKTKDELWRAAMRALFQKVDIAANFDEALFKDLDPVGRLRVMLRGFVLASARYPELGRVMNREGSSGGDRLVWLMEQFARPNYAVFDALFREGAARGLMKAYPPQMVTLLVHGAAATLFNLGAVASMLLEGDDPFAPERVQMQADMVVDIVLGGLVVTDA